MNGDGIILALLQPVTTTLGQNYPVEHSVMRDMFNCALSNMEVTNYRQLLSPWNTASEPEELNSHYI